MVAMVPHQHFRNQDVENAPWRAEMNAFWIPIDDTYTRHTRKDVGRSVMTQRAAQLRKTHNREAGQSQRDRPERDLGFTIDETAVPHHRIHSLQVMVLNQENWHD